MLELLSLNDWAESKVESILAVVNLAFSTNILVGTSINFNFFTNTNK